VRQFEENWAFACWLSFNELEFKFGKDNSAESLSTWEQENTDYWEKWSCAIVHYFKNSLQEASLRMLFLCRSNPYANNIYFYH